MPLQPVQEFFCFKQLVTRATLC